MAGKNGFALASARVNPTIAVTDLKRARKFYEELLGLVPAPETITEFGVLYACGEGTDLYLYCTAPFEEPHHPANFTVKNIEKMVEGLSKKGVVFEKHLMRELEMDDKGIATMGNQRLAWFKDPDGNVLSLLQVIP